MGVYDIIVARSPEQLVDAINDAVKSRRKAELRSQIMTRLRAEVVTENIEDGYTVVSPIHTEYFVFVEYVGHDPVKDSYSPLIW